MTTITALNVRLGMDVSNFSEGANLAKSEVTKVASIMRQSVPPAEKYKRELDLLNRAFSESGKKSQEYANAVEHLKRKHQEVAPAIRATAKASKEASTAAADVMKSIKGLAAAYLGVQTIAKSINLASQVEDATIAFEVLTGSAKDGQILFEQIRKFAAESPVTFSGATQAAKTMMSFGVAVQDVERNLRMLSDVTGGNNDRFKMLSLAFSQTSAAGRLMGQDLLQMINAGFNPLQQISKTTGESLIDLKKRMEDGGVSADEVRRAFIDATAEGGMFHGMTDRLAETVSGKLNIALSDMEKKLSEVGQAMGPLIMQLLDVFKQLEPVLKGIINLIEMIAQGIGFTVAVLSGAVSALKNAVTSFNFADVWTEIDKFLDTWEKREKERAEAIKKQLDQEFEQKRKGVNDVAVAQNQANREAAAARLRAIDEAKQAEQSALLQSAKVALDAYLKSIKERRKEDQKALLQAARATQEAYLKSVEGEKNAFAKALRFRMASVDKERKARLQAIDDERKARERAAQEAEKAFQRELENARKAAMDFFAEQAQKRKQIRDDVAKGPGSGMEVGSTEAVKFAADMVNAGIAKRAVPEEVVLNRDLVFKTAELLIKQREANELAKQQLEMAGRLLGAIKENGFQRIR